MYIDKVGEDVIVKLNEFDVEKTNIEFGDDFNIDLLKLPKKYEKLDINFLYNIKKKVGQIEYE